MNALKICVINPHPWSDDPSRPDKSDAVKVRTILLAMMLQTRRVTRGITREKFLDQVHTKPSIFPLKSCPALHYYQFHSLHGTTTKNTQTQC